MASIFPLNKTTTSKLTSAKKRIPRYTHSETDDFCLCCVATFNILTNIDDFQSNALHNNHHQFTNEVTTNANIFFIYIFIALKFILNINNENFYRKY